MVSYDMKAKQTLVDGGMNVFISKQLCSWALKYFRFSIILKLDKNCSEPTYKLLFLLTSENKKRSSLLGTLSKFSGLAESMKHKKHEEEILVEYLQTLMDVWMKVHGFF